MDLIVQKLGIPLFVLGVVVMLLFAAFGFDTLQVITGSHSNRDVESVFYFFTFLVLFLVFSLLRIFISNKK